MSDLQNPGGTMTEPIKPATDAEIAQWKADDLGLSIDGTERVFARIESDAEKLEWEAKVQKSLRGDVHRLKTEMNALRQAYEERIRLCAEEGKSDAAKLKALELARDTIQQYADQVGANLTAAEGTLAERDEQIKSLEAAVRYACSEDTERAERLIRMAHANRAVKGASNVR